MLGPVLAPQPVTVARPPVPAGVGGALGLPAGAAAALLADVVGTGPTGGLVLAAAVAAVLGAVTSPRGALVAAAQVWACWDGFVLHRLGTLQADGADLAGIAAVAGVALVASVLVAVRARRAARPRRYAPVRGIPIVRGPRLAE